MKLLVLTAIIAAVASSPLSQGSTWPWQVGKEYYYDIDTYTWTQFDQSSSNGNSFKAQFIIRVLAPGHLLAKLDKPLYAQVKDEVISYNVWPKNLKYQPVQITNAAFEIFMDGGRVKSFSVPSSLSLPYENILKGLISALQVDLSAYGHVHGFPNSFDKDAFQGLFKKMETDVIGDCETLYTVSPLSAEWRRELPEFVAEEDPVEIIKSTNFGSCQKRVAFDYGIPEGAVWQGIAYENDEKQFIKHTAESRLVAGKQGTIYKVEKLSSVFVSPLLFGKQKAEVFSFVKAYLSAVKPISATEWKKSEEIRSVNSLLFTLDEATLVLKANEQSMADAQKLLQEMSPMLQNPNKMPKADFLSKFTILVSVIGSMNSEQLAQLSNSVEIAKSSKNVAKLNMWIIYRDAVAQAGTVAAFDEIKSWIFAKKIQGEEAAQLISGIGSTLKKPTKKVMTDFFDFAMNPEIRELKIVNNSALLAATKLTRFGAEELFVVETVIPRLSKELKQAVEAGDFTKAQVFVTVLGNLAHPEILKVFAPYMDGTVAVTKYLRTQIVVNLKPLANLRNEQVRAVLFSILRNTAEPYEIRVAAALNIFLAFPTADMMQILAHMTNDDPSTQVRAVLANSIHLAAGLKDPRFAELAKTAQSVKNFVAKEKFGYRYSTDSIMDTYTSDDDYVIFRELSYIGSDDNILPKYQRSALRARGSGWTEENQITVSVSDVQQILEYVAEMFLEPAKSDVDFKFSAQKVIDMLKIKRERNEPLQGALFVDNLNQQKLITFTEEDLKDFLVSTVKNMEQLMNGVEIQYTKVLFHNQVLVAFPLAAGVPFFFAYTEPLVYSINGPVKIKFDKGSKDLAGTLQKELNFNYARNLDGVVGFIDTLGDVYTYSGVINKIQFYFPLKVDTTFKKGDFKLKFVLPEQDSTFVHLSVWPYTTSQKTDYLLPISENPATKYIERPAKVVSTDFKFGECLGVTFKVQGYSYSNDFKDIEKFFETDILTSVGNFLYQKDIALTQFNLKYYAKETTNKEITFTTFFDTLYNQKQGGEFGPATLFKDVTANSAARREELVKRSAAGIESAQVQLIDLSAVFDGQKKVEYVFTAAIAESFVDDKVQAVFFFNGWDQTNAVFKMIKPKVVPLNFKEALKNKNKVTFEAELKYGSLDNIYFKGFGERTEKYTEMLLKDPLTKQCLEETSQDNFYQMGCYKMIIKAHAPDYYKAKLTYNDLSPQFLGLTYGTYEFFKNMYVLEEESDFTSTLPEGTFEIESSSFYYEDYVNYVFKSKYGLFRLDNVENMRYFQYADAFYAPITDWERARNWYTGYQNLPYCSVDKSKVWTFAGRSYDYSLTSSWHVVMVAESNDFGRWTDLVILARRPSDKQEEIYVSYKTEAGKYVEVFIKPNSVDVKTNTKKVSEGALTSYWNDVEETPLLEYYTLADGVLVFNINNQAIRMIYDSQRLVIFTDDHRSYTRGICGESTSEARDDYMTPFGLVNQPEYYGASFSLEGEFSDPKTAELKKEAQLKAYQPVTKYTNIFRSDAEWSKAENNYAKGL